VVSAPETTLFIAPEKEIGAAVGASAIDESYAAGGVAKSHEPFAQQRDPQGGPVSCLQI
jgi:hypothetical protein